MRTSFVLFTTLTILLFSYYQTSAQTTQRRVYWLHDINEDNINSTPSAPQSDFWKNYIGESRVVRQGCMENQPGHFPFTYRGMIATPLSYYTDRPSPFGPYSVENASGTPVLRNIAKNSSSAQTVSTELRNSMAPNSPNEQRKPIIIAHGAGTLLANDIHRRFGNENHFGGILSIGGANQGFQLISSVNQGSMDRFDKTMQKAFDGGFDQYIAKREAKIISTLVSLGLTIVGGVAGALAEAQSIFYGIINFDKLLKELVKDVGGEILKKLPLKFAEKLIGFGAGFIIAEQTKTANQFIRYDGSVETAAFLLDPRAFNQYIKFAYSPKDRPLLQDLTPSSNFSTLNYQASTTATIPTVSINGALYEKIGASDGYKASPYFQTMQMAKWQNQTRNQCFDISSNPSAINNLANVGHVVRQTYAQTFTTLAMQHHADYMSLSLEMEALKTGVGTLVGLVTGGPAGALASLGTSLVFGTVGMIQAEASATEIRNYFLQGEKWCSTDADLAWSALLGATKDTTVIVSRINWPNPSIRELPEANPDGSYPRINVEVTYPIRLINDGIANSITQESPQERNWRGGSLPDASTPSGLNLEAHKIDHFSEGNHPTVKRQIERTMDATSSNLRTVRDAFRVER